MKKAIVSYNFGNYEKMPEVLWKTDGWDMFCFTDSQVNDIPDEWTQLDLLDGSQASKIFRHNTISELNPKRLANFCKYQPFKLLLDYTGVQYDILIVIDANFQVSNDLNEACERLLFATSDCSFLSHPSIHSAYDDIDLSVHLGKLDREVGAYTKSVFKEMGVPTQQTYLQTGFSIRRNTSAWQHLEYVWWKDYVNLCARDQPVFNAIISKYPVLDVTVVQKAEVDVYLNYKKHSFEQTA